MPDELIAFFNEGAQAIAVLVAPPLAVACLLGVLLALLQSAIHLQDQTLPQLAKIFTLALFLYVFGSALTSPLVSLTDTAFQFAALVK